MDEKKIVWFREDAYENEFEYAVSFMQAKEVILNQASLRVANIMNDFTFIGPTDDMTKILTVYCVDEEGMRRIAFAKPATPQEADAFFSRIKGDS